MAFRRTARPALRDRPDRSARGPRPLRVRDPAPSDRRPHRPPTSGLGCHIIALGLRHPETAASISFGQRGPSGSLPFRCEFLQCNVQARPVRSQVVGHLDPPPWSRSTCVDACRRCSNRWPASPASPDGATTGTACSHRRRSRRLPATQGAGIRTRGPQDQQARQHDRATAQFLQMYVLAG